MTRTQRILRYLRWHGVRLADDKWKIVFLPGADHFTGIWRQGDVLRVYPPMAQPVTITLRPQPKRLKRKR
jgi:hypothetical protein